MLPTDGHVSGGVSILGNPFSPCAIGLGVKSWLDNLSPRSSDGGRGGCTFNREQ